MAIKKAVVAFIASGFPKEPPTAIAKIILKPQNTKHGVQCGRGAETNQM
jgi:hypothetical protein